MPLIPLQNFGKLGVVSDTLNSALPVGTWTDARNMRFSGLQMEKMLEPSLLVAFDNVANGDLEWMQGWSDGLTTYLTVATREKLWFLRRNSAVDVGIWVDVTHDAGDYSVDGVWDSFAWGDTCIWNNGEDPPQMFDPGQLKFVDLPNWGMISNASDIAVFGAPSVDTNARCKIIRPYKNYLVACGITESEVYQPNAVWWSDATTLSSYQVGSIEGGGPPLWDYESPATLSGKNEVGVGSGEITCVCTLNENLVIYCENSATLMSAVGGGFVMAFRRLFNKGAAGQRCAVEFNNSNFVLSRDQIYLHDGSQVNLIAKDRVEEDFFRRLGKSGRFGGAGGIFWDGIQVSLNPDRKEISIIYNRDDVAYPVHVPDIYTEFTPPVVDAGGPYTGVIGQPTTITGVLVSIGTDPNPQYLWTIQSGGTGTFGDDTLLVTTFTPDGVGPYMLLLTASTIDTADVSDNALVQNISLFSRSEMTYRSGTAFNGYHDGFGMVQSTPDGQNVIFNYTAQALVHSLNGGVSFAVSGTIAWHYITCLQYHTPTATWWLNVTDSTTNNGYYFYSTNSGATWTSAFNDGYVHGFWINDAGVMYTSQYNSITGPQTHTYPSLPSSGGGLVSNIFNFIGSHETTSWHTYEIAPDEYLMMVALQGTNEMHGGIVNSTLGQLKNFRGKFVHPHRGGATRGQGTAVFRRNKQSGTSTGTTATFDVVTTDSTSIYGGPALPTFVIDFEVDVECVDIAYSTGLDGYIVSAQDCTDKRLLHLRYNVGDDFTVWNSIDPVRMTGVMSTSLDRQIYWAVGDVYYYAYLMRFGAIDVAVLERITLNAAPIPGSTGVVFHTHMDSQITGVYQSVAPHPHLTATTLIIDAANQKYGAGCMGYTGTVATGFALSNSPVAVDNNDCTIEMYYKPASLAAVAGLFHCGVAASSSNCLTAYVNMNGTITFNGRLSAVYLFTVTTAVPDALVVGTTYELGFELCRETGLVTIFINGVVKAQTTFTQQYWSAGSDDLRVGYAVPGTASTVVVTNGYIDEVRITNNSLYDSVGYTPHVAPF